MVEKTFDKDGQDNVTKRFFPNPATKRKDEQKRKLPDWDDVDLGIICITTICSILCLIGFVILIKEPASNIGAIIGVIGMGVTAIATLAGRRIKSNGNENPITDVGGGSFRLPAGGGERNDL